MRKIFSIVDILNIVFSSANAISNVENLLLTLASRMNQPLSLATSPSVNSVQQYNNVAFSTFAPSPSSSAAPAPANQQIHQPMSENAGMVKMHNQAPPPESAPAFPTNSGVDRRVDELVLLAWGNTCPQDPQSHLGSYMQGFMSLRLLLLRPSRSPFEEDLVQTMLGSFSSYSSGGRAKSDIALMLARDFMFLQSQLQQQIPLQLHMSQPHSFFTSRTACDDACEFQPPLHIPFTGLPESANGSQNSFHNSPALAPIPMSGNGTDNMSIVFHLIFLCEVSNFVSEQSIFAVLFTIFESDCL